MAHECCHMFGLVEDNNVLGGIDHHNPSPNGIYIMDDGEKVSYERQFRRPDNKEWKWRELNADYLKFILPKEEREP